MLKLISTRTYAGELLDCRNLTLECEFYQLKEDQMRELSLAIASFIIEITHENFVSKWSVDRKQLRVGTKNILDRILCMKMGWFTCEAFVKSNLIFNAKTYYQYETSIDKDFYHFRQHSPFVSVDYQNYWSALFPKGYIQNEDIPMKIDKLFNETKYKHTSIYLSPDFQSYFLAFPYSKQPNLYYGSFRITISAFCLQDCLEEYAKLFYWRMCEIAEKYIKLNARVMLQPIQVAQRICSPYMNYFGRHGNDNSHKEAGYTPQEWYPVYQVCGIEWANIISPLAQTHLNVLNILQTQQNNLDIRQISGGTLLVKSTKPIEKYTVNDAKMIKRILLPALYPGGWSISLKKIFKNDCPVQFRPRFNWAIVPVFKEEISVLGTDLIFRTKNLSLDD